MVLKGSQESQAKVRIRLSRLSLIQQYNDRILGSDNKTMEKVLCCRQIPHDSNQRHLPDIAIKPVAM